MKKTDNIKWKNNIVKENKKQKRVKTMRGIRRKNTKSAVENGL